MMGQLTYYCDADKEYWKELRLKPVTPSAVVKRINSPIDGKRMWVLDGRMTTRGYTNDWLFCPSSGLNRFSTAHSRLKGNVALDICSSYGISSRTFLDGGHTGVVIIEPEELVAEMVVSNMSHWGYDNFEVWQSRDWSNVNFENFDSIRFGHPDLEMLFHKYTDSILQARNIVFEQTTISNLTKEILLDAGYTKPLAWNGVQIYSSINKV